MGIDFRDYFTRLGQEKFRAIIIHGPPSMGWAMSEFGVKMARSVGGTYCDLLSYFLARPDLAETIDRFGLEQFKELLLEQSQGLPLLVVDRADFLLDTWRKAERLGFYRLVRVQWNSFVTEMNATLAFCMQTSPELLDLNIIDSHGDSRVHPLSSFDELR